RRSPLALGEAVARTAEADRGSSRGGQRSSRVPSYRARRIRRGANGPRMVEDNRGARLRIAGSRQPSEKGLATNASRGRWPPWSPGRGDDGGDGSAGTARGKGLEGGVGRGERGAVARADLRALARD